METKKRKYVKPKLTVAEWDFNEAVCQDNTMLLSLCLKTEQGDVVSRHSNLDDPNWNGSIDWKSFEE